MLWSRQPDEAVCTTAFHQSINSQDRLRLARVCWIHTFMGLRLARCCYRPTGLMQGAVIARLRLFAWSKRCLNKTPGNVWGSLVFFRQKSNKCFIQISLAICFPPIILHSTPNHPTNKQSSFGYKWQISSLSIPWDRQMFPVHPMLSHWTHTHTHTHTRTHTRTHTHTHTHTHTQRQDKNLTNLQGFWEIKAFLGILVLFLPYKCTEMLVGGGGGVSNWFVCSAAQKNIILFEMHYHNSP